MTWVLAGIAGTCVVLGVATAVPARSRLVRPEDRWSWGCTSVALFVIAVWFGVAAVTR